MSEPRVAWICIDTSGVSVRGEPSTGERKVTPSSVSFDSCESENTWKPPESVRMGRDQPTILCSPPCAAMTSRPGRSQR